jgi:hypothetical protein
MHSQSIAHDNEHTTIFIVFANNLRWVFITVLITSINQLIFVLSLIYSTDIFPYLESFENVPSSGLKWLKVSKIPMGFNT